MNLHTFRLCLIVLLPLGVAPAYTQETESAGENEYLSVYKIAKDQFGIDPLLMNGVYYENPYYNAKGHPFLGDGEFYLGTVNFRNKKYENVNLKYDIYNQQLIIDQSRIDRRASIIFQNVRYQGLSIQIDDNNQQIIINEDAGSPKITNLLANEFVSEFTMDGMQFRKLILEDDKEDFYQVISEDPELSCYNYLYKNRFKSQDEGDRTIYVFSRKNFRSYLVRNGQIYKYRNNRTFLKAFQGEEKNRIKAYIKTRSIKVNNADDLVMKNVLMFCQQTIKQD